MTQAGQRFDMQAEAMGPGAYLRAAREAAGWSLEQAAQQLKLAPRQVKALEEEDFAQLPGRTFARGFVRNYARLLNLDAEELLAALPDATRAPGLGAPALHSTSTMMGELPTSESAKPNFARWLIPLALIGCIVAAASYEWYRGGLSAPGELAARTEKAGERPVADAAPQPTPEVAPAPGAATTAQPGTGVTPQLSGTPLPNPFVTDARPPASGTGAPAAEPARPSAASETVASVTPPAQTSPSQPAAAPSVPQAPAAAAQVAPASPPTASGASAALVLKYRGPSWTEVKDRSGQVLIARLVAANSVQPIDGIPPFHIVLGNARVVSLAYRGKSIDLSRYTRQNVARLTLR